MAKLEITPTVTAAIAQAVTDLGDVRRQSPARTQAILDALAQRVAAITRDDTLLGLRSTAEVAAELGVDVSTVRYAAQRRAEQGGGHKVGRSWIWSAEEVDAIRRDIRGLA